VTEEQVKQVKHTPPVGEGKGNGDDDDEWESDDNADRRTESCRRGGIHNGQKGGE
jgi:hypothetical protein